MKKDVTKKVRFSDPEGESLSLLECICGEKFDFWEFIIHNYDEPISPCTCGRKFVFQNNVRIFQIK